MAQNSPERPAKRPRGRPRAYEPEKALALAMEAFWEGGYSGTSLDTLAEKMGMNRPSLYGAFGDKQQLYLKALERYSDSSRAFVKAAFEADQSLSKALMQVYTAAIDLYVSGNKGQRGCFSTVTAATEAATNPVVREAYAMTLKRLDGAFEGRFKKATADGDLPSSADPKMLGRLATAIIHTLALRARGGEPRAALIATAKSAVEMLAAKGRR
jgi:AcrR family transcriptional regulator